MKEALAALPLPSKKLHGNLDQDPYEHAFTTGSDILICAITAAYLRPAQLAEIVLENLNNLPKQKSTCADFKVCNEEQRCSVPLSGPPASIHM